MSRLARVALLSLMGLLASAAPAQAYVVLKHWNSGNTQKWSKATVTWTMTTSTPAGHDPNALQQALAAAFASWQAVPCATIGFTWGGFKAADPGNGIHFYFQQTTWDPAVGDALAYSQSQSDWSGTITSNDIVFNAAQHQWSTAAFAPPGFQDVQGVATHEIGHSLGLDHSRHRQATMFFSGGSADLRSLEPDDQNGLCFLYPKVTFTQGAACDACTADSHCKAGPCLNWGGGHTYCGQTCTSSSQCPSGFSCWQLESGATTCLPDNEFCHQAGQNIAMGDYCYGHETCQAGLFCLPLTDDAMCTRECTAAKPCPSGFACTAGICMKAGSKPYGAPCQESSECATAACIQFQSGGVCSSYCGKNGGSCPAGHQCYQDVACVPPGPSPNGTKCLSPTQCQGTWCEANLCTQPCGVGSPCPTGTTCQGGFCVGAATGGQCQDGGQCPDEMVCQKLASGVTGTCERACNPLLADSGCPGGQVCKWRWEAGTQTITGTCVPAIGGKQVGEACDDVADPCELDLVCVAGTFDTPTCHRDCKIQSNNLGCATLEKCVSLDDPGDPKRGLCIDPNPPQPTADPDPADAGPTAPDVAVAPDAAPAPDPGPEPDTAAADDLAQGADAPPADGAPADALADAPPLIPGTQPGSSGPSGCAGGGGATSAWAWCLALLLGAASRRRRSPRPAACRRARALLW